MSTTEIEVRQPRPQANAAALPAKIQYARELANSGLLPAAYRRNPGNILYAVEFGEMLGLTPMAAITGVHVIEGKPSASAGLISALVRRAGHKLRVFGDSKSATCQIVRADDPEFTFAVTWTLKRNADDNPSAEEAGLLGKNIWKNYPASMLKSRAITQCARDACEEALFGLHYTPEELGAEVDEDGAVVGGVAQEAAAEAQVVETDQEWLAATMRIIPSIGLDACRNLWRETVEKHRAAELTLADRDGVLAALTARMESLKTPDPAQAEAGPPCEAEADFPAADALDPEDPWAAKVEELGSEDDAAAALDEATGMLSDGTMDAARFGRVEDAILARFPAAGGEAQAAA
jgi:hypothetical protein